MNREIWVNREFSQDMANGVVQQLMALDKEGRDPIKIYINSPGGDVNAMFSIIDARMVLKSPVYTVNYGEAASAAAALFASGDKRFIMENARVMIHAAWGLAIGNADEVQEQAEALRALTDKYVKLLSKYTGKKEEDIKKDIDGQDLWMDAEEAIQYGAADMVLTEKLKEKYSLQARKPGPATKQKEVKEMTKKELLALLKNEHDVDVESMSVQLGKAKGDLEAAFKTKADLEAKLEASKKEASDTKAQLSKLLDKVELEAKERCFDGLVKDLKEIPARKEVVMAQFKDAEAMAAFYKDMPARLASKPLGEDGKDVPAEDLELKAKMAKYGLTEEK